MKTEHVVLLVLFLYSFNLVQAYGAEIHTYPEKKLLLNLSTDLISAVTGNRTSFMAYVENVGSEAVGSVNISIEGIFPVEVLPASADIPAKHIQSYLLTFDVPEDAESGIYEVKVKATNEAESNTEALSLIVGKNLKEVADILLKEFEDAKNLAERSLLAEDCLDVTVMKVIHEDAGYAYKRGLEEYGKDDYNKAISWFEHAIVLERKVAARVDKILEAELNSFKALRIVIPRFYESESVINQVQTYYEERNYEEICNPVLKTRKYIMVGMIFWPIVTIVIVLLLVLFVIFYRRKRKEERVSIIERVRERLGKAETIQ